MLGMGMDLHLGFKLQVLVLVMVMPLWLLGVFGFFSLLVSSAGPSTLHLLHLLIFPVKR